MKGPGPRHEAPESAPWALPGDVLAAIAESETTIAVVGATGWMGRASLDLLGEVLGPALEGRVRAFSSRQTPIRLASGQTLMSEPLSALSALPQRPTVFLHYAFLTKDRVADFSLSDFVALNRQIADTVVHAAQTVPVRGLFVPSSGAVYRPDRTLDDDITANPYGVLKVEDERRFLDLAERLGCPLVVPRVFNLAGPYINKHGAYALSSILLDILGGGPVRLRATQPVLRSYIHVSDLVGLALAHLLCGDGSALPPFDTAGEREIEVGELAELAREILGVSGVVIERPALTTGSPNRYVGNGATMATLARSRGLSLRALPAQIADTARFLASAEPAP